MKRFMLILLVGTLWAACSKDEAVESDSFDGDRLSEVVASARGEHVVSDQFAIAGVLPRLSDRPQREPLICMSWIPRNAREIRYFETDSLRYRDSLALYRSRSIDLESSPISALRRIRRPNRDMDRFGRFSWRVGDSLYVSRAIKLRGNVTLAEKIERISADHDEDGYFDFNWSSVPGADHYLVLLKGQRDDLVVGIITQRSQFQFYDLRAVDHNFFPNLTDPQMTDGGAYELEVIAFTDHGWVLGQGTLDFIYEE